MDEPRKHYANWNKSIDTLLPHLYVESKKKMSNYRLKGWLPGAPE